VAAVARPRAAPQHGALHDRLADIPGGVMLTRAGGQALWLLGLLAGVLSIGMLPSLLIFMVANMILAGRTHWRPALGVALPLFAGMYLLFVQLLHLPWPASLLGDALPALRAATGRLI